MTVWLVVAVPLALFVTIVSLMLAYSLWFVIYSDYQKQKEAQSSGDEPDADEDQFLSTLQEVDISDVWKLYDEHGGEGLEIYIRKK